MLFFNSSKPIRVGGHQLHTSMKKTATIFLGILAGSAALFLAPGVKADDATTQASGALTKSLDAGTQPAPLSAEVQKSIDARADSVVKNLNIDDSTKATRVHDSITTFLTAIHQWHQQNDARLKQLGKTGGEESDQIQAERHTIHDAFLAKLSADLTPDQIDTVKEKLTGGQMMATYRNYPEIVPDLTDQEKAKVLETLKQGREEAMDSGSRTERIAIFKKYKGQINNYLNANGHHVAQDYKDFGKTQKAKKSAATQATTEPSDGAAN
jgi:hypothetical protein